MHPGRKSGGAAKRRTWGNNESDNAKKLKVMTTKIAAIRGYQTSGDFWGGKVAFSPLWRQSPTL